MKNLFHISILVSLLVFFLPDRSFAVLQAHPAPPKQESFWKRLRQTARKFIQDAKAWYSDGAHNRSLMGFGLLFGILLTGVFWIFRDALENSDTIDEVLGILLFTIASAAGALAFFVVFLIGLIYEIIRIISSKIEERKKYD